ncbi:MAG: flagellar assembly peptidoglycan hydrolase FlgJ [Pseudomonadota bacterium]
MMGSMGSAGAHNYTDFHGIAEMRGRAQKDPEGQLDEVAEQFEAVFLQMMLKGMRSTTPGNPLFEDSNAMDTYEELYDKQMANNLVSTGSIGIADMVRDQLRPIMEGRMPTANDRAQGAVEGNRGGDDLAEYLERAPGVMGREPAADASSSSRGQREEGGRAEVGDEPFESPRDFVERLWPQAKEAADELGVGPEVLLAQAALETGWGRNVAHGEDGRNSRNLFNIKSHGDEEGDSVAIQTREFMGGRMVSLRDEFRAYDSYEESFNDYVDFLRENPRYREALEAPAQDDFIRGLQDAGYATDPEYAGKIQRVIDSPAMAEALEGLKVS